MSDPDLRPALRAQYLGMEEKEAKTDPRNPPTVLRSDSGPRDSTATGDAPALLRMFDAYQELKRLGWNDAIYCPKDGT